MIEMQIEMIVVIPLNRRRDEVLAWRGAVRLGIKSGNRHSHRVQENTWNLVPRKRLTRKWIDQRAGACGKIAGAFGKRGHVADARDAFMTPEAFVIAKQERSILSDGTAKRSSELVALILGLRNASLSEEVACVEGAVTEKFPCAAVQGVGS